ncbi:PH domain-containing protein [Streptacidiphilus sp. PB12-B1b]|uniref:PH domain-containing protein n=1 Tax=Streptacidiphilus sp. PB12-B1b TaxID=2705012 RepID=UPI0015FD952B|nr:PH domain-containing protein [Streptacidiphilus sp. PB12-B1b]QMU79214.1 PH domain-containing protein [Streptacidiphilus sp. PB12-B1b]
MSDAQQQNRPGQEPSGEQTPAQETPAEPSAAEAAPRKAAPAASPASGSGTGAGSSAPAYGDLVFRSTPSVLAGGLIIVLVLWLAIDAIVDGRHRAPLEGVAAILFLVPLIGAYTIWPCVRANADRLVVRNPLRTITVAWTDVESLQSALSVELRTGGRKYQVWAIPVSLRQRKRGNRRAMRQLGDSTPQTSSRRGRFGGGQDHPVGGPGLRSRGLSGGPTADPTRAWADGVVDQLNEIRELAGEPTNGAAQVRWTWWIIAPAVVGGIALVTLLAG